MGYKSYKYQEHEVLGWANYYAENVTTLMEMEGKYNVSHSTIWWNFIHRLPWLDYELYQKVLSKIESNKLVRPAVLERIKQRDAIEFGEELELEEPKNIKDEQTEALRRYNEQQAIIVAEYVKKSIILELNEISDLIWCSSRINYSTDRFIYYDEVAEIINNRIKELKGDGNDSTQTND